MPPRNLRFFLAAIIGAIIFSLALIGFAAALIYPRLPSLEALTDYRPKVPLRVYTGDGALIGEFGEERRALVKIGDVPWQLKQAILAAEDERFYEHGGVDSLGVMRAALSNLLSGEAKEGASTITMQVARNFFLTREKTFTRKLHEALLSFKIEHSLSKDQILELYINQIYLGQRAYGFATAAQIYFGKKLGDVTLAEAAMLAGLPKAPSAFNPVVNPTRAKARQQYVLHRMRSLNMISDPAYRAALSERLLVRQSSQLFDVPADYVAEMVRQIMFERFGDAIYTSGMKVYTTLRQEEQSAAYRALIKGVLDYDQRHGYRGPEAYFALPSDPARIPLAVEEMLQNRSAVDGLQPAVVISVGRGKIKAQIPGGTDVEIKAAGLKFVQHALSHGAPRKQRIVPGALIRVIQNDAGRWAVGQLPQVESAIVGLDAQDGAIRALVGGFDFQRNKFNHAIQAWRQPGSSFKPFVYSAALEKGITPATLLNDEPFVLSAEETGSNEAWEPKNFDGTFEGPITMRRALTLSKNLASVDLIRKIEPGYAQDYIRRFGFDAGRHPPYLTLALGAGTVTPLELAAAYSVFANGGYRIKPYLIERILDARGTVLDEAKPERAAVTAQRVLDPRNVFIMTSMLRDVVVRGTGARVSQLGRTDLAGKTGTTNDQHDGWFAGFHPSRTAVAWMGYDQPRSLGGGETGAQAALPIWMDYMGSVLKGIPQAETPIPAGLLTERVDPVRGTRIVGDREGIVEYFYQEYPPAEEGALHGERDGIPLLDLLPF
jgi:penicillin-binding protein 1A